MNFDELLDAAEKCDVSKIKHTKLAILGSHATQFLNMALQAAGQISEINYHIYEADYDQIEMEILNPDSGLYEFAPDYVFIIQSGLSLQKLFYQLKDQDKANFADMIESKWNDLTLQLLEHRPKAKVLLMSYELLNDNVFGNYYPKVRNSFYHQLTEINYRLMKLAEKNDSLYLVDTNSLFLRRGIDQARNWSQYVNSDLHFSLDFYADISIAVTGIIASLTGRFKKCVILDLDNTLWGGVIGDDGLSNIQIGSLGIGKAFTNFQKWLLQLKERGIILAVCSKNTEEVAKEPFLQHREMILRLDDISVFVANWSNKADNIRYIQDILNIGFDSMVFVDDNPAEREIVRNNLPMVCVPELPEDPALYLDYLISLNLFETTTHSENDSIRTKQYQEESERKKLQFTVTNMDEFLASLEMTGSIEPFTEEDFPRLAQLSQRSNQFNLRTVRHTQSDIEQLAHDPKYITMSVKLRDKFGDYGLISIIIVELRENREAFINTWLMSCRVLKRGVEELVLNYIIEKAKEKGYDVVIGEYLPTAKNKLVEKHYPNLGFETCGENLYKIEVNNYNNLKHFIKND